MISKWTVPDLFYLLLDLRVVTFFKGGHVKMNMNILKF
jgi:hypothetical protein